MREDCRKCARSVALSETQVLCKVRGWLSERVPIPDECEHFTQREESDETTHTND